MDALVAQQKILEFVLVQIVAYVALQMYATTTKNVTQIELIDNGLVNQRGISEAT